MAACVVLGAVTRLGLFRDQHPQARTAEFLSDTYVVDRIYRSMKGPQSTQSLTLLDTEEPELLWITGYRATMVGPDGLIPVSQEFMCHSNLDWDPGLHNAIFGQRPTNSRLFTLSQGQFAMRFPTGFGIPILSSEALSLTTQVLNLNYDQISQDVRHRIIVEFVRDRDLKAPYKALFGTSAYVLVSLEDEALAFGEEDPSAVQRGAWCLPGENASTHIYTDAHSRRFTGHFVVKPGRHRYRTLATHQMNLLDDTTIHYIAVHLHPFAESIELRDLTTGESVYKSYAKNFKGKIGLDTVDHLSSETGIPVYKSHEYEVVSVYNNTTSVDQDSMAVLFLYYREKDLRIPARFAHR